ncbi:MAG: glycosyltransferase family 2 protein [Erysipelotrichaceae bacterium]|nr:glycosyltransferase family 2 protein [Erysipelotrichaceae bacterium]
MRVLVIIPAYNEAGNIVRVVNNLREKCPQADYVVINDGSRDETAQLCRENGFHLIDQPVNLGLAGTFQTGMKYAYEHDYDAAVQFDGDGQHRPEYIQAMADRIAAGADIVIGSRFVNESKPKSLRMFGSNILQSFIRLTTGTNIKDPTSGMRMYSRRIIKVLAGYINMGPEPDTVAYLIRSGAKCEEIQVKMDERLFGESYLNLKASIKYMTVMSISILLIGCFRPKVNL